MMGPDRYFILIYDIGRHKVEVVDDFGEDGAAAAEAYAQVEGEYRDRDDIEVLMVGADSIDTIKKTHSHYFDRVPEALDELIRRLRQDFPARESSQQDAPRARG